ncbi:hypothetical protein [Marinobacter gelidimuriae]|uniref:hypothetical protein n=1 Tax=Marinobacter gelidimuriae TaxID=2739064 RepID=UPI00037DB336|nr:hypothetical protein [Marinobacter gelidimuriae]
MKVLVFFLVAILITGCGVNKAKIASQAEGPKEIFVSLAGDPLLISVELKQELAFYGYAVALSTEESLKDVQVNSGDRSTTFKNVSDSNYRYELSLGYRPIQDRIQLIAASLRDRKTNTVLGTYRWSWSRGLPAPTIEEAIAMIHRNLLSPIFQ